MARPPKAPPKAAPKVVPKAEAIVPASKTGLTATQDRNARKRAAKKKASGEAKEVAARQDPSLKYINDPAGAPIVHQARLFFREVGVRGQIAVRVGPRSGWRTEAKLAVRASAAGRPVIGLFIPGSHDVCSLGECLAHHDAINVAVRHVEAACYAVGCRGYDEARESGDLRYIKLEVQRSTGKVQLTLVWHAASESAAGPLLPRLVESLQQEQAELWYNIWVNYNAASKHVSRILNFDPSSWQQLAGRNKAMRERLTSISLPYGHPALCFPPFVFRQANICAFESIVTALRDYIVPESRVVELYGGVGTIGLHVVDLVASLECSDENPHNLRCFERSARELPEALAARVSYRSGDASSQVDRLSSADLLIADPPRKGLDDLVLEVLDNPPKDLRRLIYVSCGFPALQRDLVRLLAAGWTLVHVEGFVLFPGADHLETFCVLDSPAGGPQAPPGAAAAAGGSGGLMTAPPGVAATAAAARGSGGLAAAPPGAAAGCAGGGGGLGGPAAAARKAKRRRQEAAAPNAAAAAAAAAAPKAPKAKRRRRGGKV